jgi:hypothetical protein
MRPCARRFGTPLGSWLEDLAASGMRPSFEILEEIASKDLVDDAEMRWIARGRSSGWALVNVSAGGTGSRGVRPNEASRAKMSAHAKARAHVSIPRMLAARGPDWSPSAETRLKMSEAHKGFRMSDNSRAKLSASKKKPIVDDLGRVWPSMKDAAAALGLHPGTISDCVRGRLRTAGGRVFRRLEGV